MVVVAVIVDNIFIVYLTSYRVTDNELGRFSVQKSFSPFWGKRMRICVD